MKNFLRHLSLLWQRNSAVKQSRAEQVIGRERETATLIKCCLLNLCLPVAGFAPRQCRAFDSFASRKR